MKKIIDISKVQEILLDDKEEIAALLKIFLSTFPEFMETIERSVERKDISGFKFAMHKFKSSCQFVASPAFVGRLKTFESLEIKDFDDHKADIADLKAEALQLQQEVRDYLKVTEMTSD